ncbi:MULTISPECIES: FAD-dependent monooxygenase [Priestia]|uniref:FAD-dependent monooxygenase n=1 Tax=Priestia TaxID=2800373 RepID=UPI00064FE386|nr:MULTISPECIES: FAD-dependent monooxygenase [Priestia]KML27253.1 FAD-binding protein [Priestia aryabhattai]KMN98834.1 FAD-binding protein [Priestia aryabhattai]QDZ80691.1 FAD-dependent oxidoreductase [Priestia megaterium]
MNYQTDVCIIGAGPGGALLAYLLAKQNISTILIERSDKLGKEFRGEHLNEDGEMILKKHHIFEEIESLGLLRMSRVEYWKDGHVFKTIESELGHAGIHVPQQHLLQSINRQASLYPSYKLMLGTKVTELMQNEKGQYTGIKAEQKGRGEIIVESKIIIGADGRYSTVRKLAHIKNNIHNPGYDLLWAKIPAPEKWKPTIRFTVVNNQQMALFTQTGGFIQIGWNIKKGSYTSLKKQSVQPFLDQLILAFPQLKESIEQNLHSWKNFILLSVYSSHCDTWVKDGLAIIGDAAHTMTPTGAYGMNAAIMDADVLSQILPKLLSHGSLEAGQLKKFENARRKIVEDLQDQQAMTEASFIENFSAILKIQEERLPLFQ